MDSLANNLYALRKEKGLTRKAVAEALHLAERTYQRYENAEREPVASVLAAIADFYGVTVDSLLGRKEQ